MSLDLRDGLGAIEVGHKHVQEDEIISLRHDQTNGAVTTLDRVDVVLALCVQQFLGDRQGVGGVIDTLRPNVPTWGEASREPASDPAGAPAGEPRAVLGARRRPVFFLPRSPLLSSTA